MRGPPARSCNEGAGFIRSRMVAEGLDVVAIDKHRLATLLRCNLVLKIENAKAAFLTADVIPQGTPAEC